MNDFWKQNIVNNMEKIRKLCKQLYYKAWENQGKDYYIVLDKAGNVSERVCNHGWDNRPMEWYSCEVMDVAYISFYQNETITTDKDIEYMLKKMKKTNLLYELEDMKEESIEKKMKYLTEIGEYELIHELDMKYIIDNEKFFIDEILKNITDLSLIKDGYKEKC